MSLFLSAGLYAEFATAPGNHLPLILWENLVTVSNIEADHEDADYPATNAANPATNLYWLSDDTGDQDVIITLSGTDPVDCVGIADHNFGTAGITVSIEADTGSGYAEVFAGVLPGTDEPLMFLFDEIDPIAIKISLLVGDTAPQAAVIFVGKSLRLEWGVKAGHTPLTYGRVRDIVTGRSQGGHYLGRMQSGGFRQSRAEWGNLDPDFYRDEVDPFIAYGGPFFFAWAPEAYSGEVAYCWPTNDPVPVPALAGHIDISLDLEGIGLPVAENG